MKSRILPRLFGTFCLGLAASASGPLLFADQLLSRPPAIPFTTFEDSAASRSLSDDDGAVLETPPTSSGTCSTGCSSGCNSGCSSGLWIRAETLIWWTEGRRLPALVTTSPTGTARAQAGVLPGAEVLFGDEEIGEGERVGGRWTIGQWADSTQTTGLMGSYFVLETSKATFSSFSQGDPILARPFFNAALGQEDALLVAFPGVSTGGIGIRADNHVQGAEALVRTLFSEGAGYRVDAIGGYVFHRIDDGLSINSPLISTDGLTVPVGTRFDIVDNFDAENQFHGATFGFLTEVYRGPWTIELLTKLGMGNMNQEVTISGSTVVTEPNNGPNQLTGGLLTQQSNIGQFEENDFVFVPEVGLNLSYEVREGLEVGLGYSFIYWTRLALAADQIDPSVNLTQQSGPLVGPATPQFSMRETDFWAQGLNFNATLRY